MILRVTRRTLPLDAEGGKAIHTIVISKAADALSISISITGTERCVATTARIIGDITGLADAIDALTALRRAISITRTLNTFGTIIPIEAQSLISVTATVGAQLACCTAAPDTGRGLIWTVAIFCARRTAQPTRTGHTEWRRTTAARIIRHVTQLAGIGHTLARRTTTVSIG